MLLNCLLIELRRVVDCAALEAVVGTARVIRVKVIMCLCLGYDAGNRSCFIDCCVEAIDGKRLTLALLSTGRDLIWWGEHQLLMEQR